MPVDTLQKKIWFAILIGVVALGIGRISLYAWEFGNKSLQMDFAAFYTAGEAREAGLSPYVNHMDQDDPIWDGVSVLRHSRFLYPPITARFFQPLSWMSYSWAKGFWIVLSLVCLGSGLFLFMKSLFPMPSIFVMLIVWGGALWFHPVLTLLERGQVDGVTFLLLAVCFVLSQKSDSGQIWSGVSLALATFLKLHCVYFMPFLVLRRKWFAIAGFGACFLFGMVTSVIIDGYELNRSYVAEHLPRIARYGEGGTPEQMMPRFVLAPHIENLQTGFAVMDGIRYKQTALDFVASATLVDFFMGPVQEGGGSDSSWISGGMFVLMFLGVLGMRLGDNWNSSQSMRIQDWAYWLLGIVIVLLCAPTTWVMNVVWMLPMFGVIGVLIVNSAKNLRWPLYLAVVGLFFTGVPDHYSLSIFKSFQDVLEYKYIIGEVITLFALGWLLVVLKDQESEIV